MKLNQILKNIDYQLIKGTTDIEIKDLAYDSRSIKKDFAFIALPGIDTDGHFYIKDAIKNGSNCLIVEKDITIEENITIIKLKNTREQLSYLSANFFQNPEKHLIKIALTGTKGKTSTAWMIKQILENAGFQVGFIGTIGTYINNQFFPHKNTTPESYEIQKFMRMMVDDGCQFLVMETSSQALKVGRVNNITFEYGLFTNLSIDHIGKREHPTYEDYKESKAKLFKQCLIGIINQDDQERAYITKIATCKNIYTYGTTPNCTLNIEKIIPKSTNDFFGMQFKTTGLTNNTFEVSAPGYFSVYNATAAILLCKILKINDTIIKNSLHQFHVAGRCEILNLPNQIKVIIDFAHNKISLESIIKTMKDYPHNRIITLFGCGGGRSFERRYELGEIAGSLSDLTIITADNPRYDNLDEINHDIQLGVNSKQGKSIIINDRLEAIQYALKTASSNDIILLLGKGHEKFQEIGGQIIPFNEQNIIEEFLKEQQNASK